LFRVTPPPQKKWVCIKGGHLFGMWVRCIGDEVDLD